MSLTGLPAGTTINDRYELVAKLGSYGSVYRAHDRYLEKQVAIKLLEPEGGNAQSWDEARRLEQLRSRFLVDVINADVVINSDIRFIVTPVVHAGDLEAAAAPMGLSVADAVRYAQQIASGIDRIHAAGMVHRDVKPGNVLLDGGEVLVTDLEYCELLNADGRADRNGTWCTVAPEAAPDDGYCSVGSEVYSLGATTYYLLSGEYPVDHRLPPQEQRNLIVAGRLREVRLLAPHVSQAVGTVVRKALSLDPAKRFSSALDFANALVHAARDTRDWRRLDHPGHTHCLDGKPHAGKAGVSICAYPDGPRVRIEARHQPTGRRISGCPDADVTPGQLSRALQRAVKGLG